MGRGQGEEEGREGGRGEDRGREGWERKERRAQMDRLFVAGNHHATNTHIGFRVKKQRLVVRASLASSLVSHFPHPSHQPVNKAGMENREMRGENGVKGRKE